jgi:DNA-binding transcriptional ArsR family regulator
MDEMIMQVARTVACLARLRILARVAQQGELAPTRLARDLRMPLHMVSAHLRRLTAAGLIQRRRSGVWSYCVPCLRDSDRMFGGRLAAWLTATLKNPSAILNNCRVGQLCNHENDPQERLLALVFEAATAFTNVRRLQILRRLRPGEVMDVVTLSAGLRMSPPAVSRHMGKLIRRGYVVMTKSGRVMGYKLATRGKSPVHTRFFALVRAEWTA